MRIGILGSGQLGRMLALAGYPLGLEFAFLDPSDGEPVRLLADFKRTPFDDPAGLAWLARQCDVVTYEFENVPAAAVAWLESRVPVRPGSRALAASQDRAVEKRFFRDLGIPVPAFAGVDSREDLDAALAVTGLPAVLKTRFHGYDGKGQFVLRAPRDADAAWRALGGQPSILEAFVPFDREVSVVAARGLDGATVVYPLVENTHGDGILRRTLAPAPRLDPALQAAADSAVRRVLEALDYTGTLALELFQCGGELLANEMATRVHNSGHWTIEGAATSQFENHLRAIAGWPLGPARAIGCSAMFNLVGDLPDPAAVLAVPGAHLHLYGKDPRPARKVGHVTLWAGDAAELAQRRGALEPLLPAAD